MADGSPFRIKFTPIVCTSDAAQDSHIAHCKAVPLVKRGRNGALAVVGSGPSVSAHIDELRAFDGEVWGINGAASWLAKQGVDAALVTVDAKQFDPWMYEGVKSAVVASCAHPSLFDHFAGNVEKFHMAEHAPGGVFGGVTTATRMAGLGIMLGFTSITFYGCEGSFSGSDHVNQNEQLPDQLIVKAGGELHRTYPEFLLQAENLAAYIDQYPEIFKERSGGLLRGLVGNADTWSIVAVSSGLKEKLESQCGSHGLYDDKFDLQQTSLAVAG